MPHATLPRLRIADAVPPLPDRPSMDIIASLRIQADTRRVLNALAMPEYMETWLQLPEIDRIECHSNLGPFGRFRLELYSNCESRGIIDGLCHLSKHQDKVTYFWDRLYAGTRATSMVEFSLRGGLRRCTLKLKHGAFSNRAETEWHSTMWHLSLHKLSGLLEGIATAH